MGDRRVRTVVLAGAVAMLAFATSCAPPYSALTQIRAIVACITNSGYGGESRDGRVLDEARAASTPNGRHLYVLGADGDALAIISRSSAGELSQKSDFRGCFIDETF